MNTGGGIFFTRRWEPDEEWFWRLENFSKLKQHFVNTEHQLKSKLAWSVFQEYEIKTKMVQEQWLQLKMTFLFFIGLNWLLVGREEWANFWLVWEDSPHSEVGKPCIYIYIVYIYIYSIYIYIYIYKYYTYYTYTYIKELCQQAFIYNEEGSCTLYTSWAKVAILLLQDLSTLCVTDIYGIYFHLSVQCL